MVGILTNDVLFFKDRANDALLFEETIVRAMLQVQRKYHR
jgi:hypothetical protein